MTKRAVVKIKKAKGEQFCYWVTSRSGADWHKVDMTQRSGHGACTCYFFQFRAQKNLKSIGRHIPYQTGDEGKCSNAHAATECAHIRAARTKIEDGFLRPLLSSQANGVTPAFVALIRAVIGAGSKG